MKWIKTSDKLHPDAPGLKKHEDVLCLILRKHGRPVVRSWNCTHMVWDDEEGDDFYCEASDVEWWAIIEWPEP